VDILNHIKLIQSVVDQPNYLCKSCARVANLPSFLCKPMLLKVETNIEQPSSISSQENVVLLKQEKKKIKEHKKRNKEMKRLIKEQKKLMRQYEKNIKRWQDLQ